MTHPYHHVVSSSETFGGRPEEYQAIHDWFDQTKAHLPDVRHRALLHASFQIFLCEQVFGTILTHSTGRHVPVRLISKQHVMEDISGVIPTVQDWLGDLPLRPHTSGGARKLEGDEAADAHR